MKKGLIRYRPLLCAEPSISFQQLKVFYDHCLQLGSKRVCTVPLTLPLTNFTKHRYATPYLNRQLEAGTRYQPMGRQVCLTIPLGLLSDIRVLPLVIVFEAQIRIRRLIPPIQASICQTSSHWHCRWQSCCRFGHCCIQGAKE